MLFNAESIILGQQWLYLTHRWEDKGVHTFPKGVCPKVNVIARLEFELAYYDSALLHHGDIQKDRQTFILVIYFIYLFAVGGGEMNKLWGTFLKWKKLIYISLSKKDGLVCFIGFYGISTLVGYLTPNPFLCK